MYGFTSEQWSSASTGGRAASLALFTLTLVISTRQLLLGRTPGKLPYIVENCIAGLVVLAVTLYVCYPEVEAGEFTLVRDSLDRSVVLLCGLFSVLVLWSLAQSPTPVYFLGDLFYFGAPFVFLWSMRRLPERRSDLLLGLTLVVGTLAVQAIFKVPKYLAGDWGDSSPVVAPHVILFTSLVMLPQLSTRARDRQVWCYAAAGGSLLLTVLSTTRTEWVGVVVALGVLGWLGTGVELRTVLGAVGISAFVGSLLVILLPGGTEVLGMLHEEVFSLALSMEHSPTNSVWVKVMEGVIVYGALLDGGVISVLFGKGFGSQYVVAERWQSFPSWRLTGRVDHTLHNLLVHSVFRVGVVGTLAFVGVLAQIVTTLYPGRDPRGTTQVVRTIVFATFVAMLVMSMSTKIRLLYFPVWGLAGMALSHSASRRNDS